MTPAQQAELRRLTPNMRSLLHQAHSRGDLGTEIRGQASMRTANILERRGFVTVMRTPKGRRHVRLTDAGREAVQSRTPDNQ